jgi:hypothetical protein
MRDTVQLTVERDAPARRQRAGHTTAADHRPPVSYHHGAEQHCGGLCCWQASVAGGADDQRAARHRIRVEISSSNFPRFARPAIALDAGSPGR